MTITDVIQAAIPNASPDMVEFILWERTPYPFGALTARTLYQAAARWRRAKAHGHQLCDLCDRLVAPGEKWLCRSCADAMARCRE